MALASPQTNLHELGLQPGMEVADLGAGAGHYTLPAARMVGEKGHVCAVEIQKDLVSKIKNEAESQGLSNVDVVWSDLEKTHGSTLDEETVDAVILANVLFQVNDIDAVIAEAYRILRPGGKALIVDWSDSHGGLGPPDDHIISQDILTKSAQEVGFITSQDLSVGPHHWGVIFTKQ